MIKRTIVNLNSTVINSASLCNKALTISIDGSIYVYTKVPRSIFRGLDKAASPGRYFNEKIKGKYACSGPF